MKTLLLLLIIIFIIVLITYFKGKNHNRTIVVYEDWNDIGLSFFSIIFPAFITIILMNIEFLLPYSLQIGFFIMIILLGKLAIHTYKSNNGNILYFLMAYITKIFLGITLFTQIINLISPKEDENGDSNFWSALLILMIVIPMVNNLVVNKNQGSKINPLKWISSRNQFTKLI